MSNSTRSVAAAEAGGTNAVDYKTMAGQLIRNIDQLTDTIPKVQLSQELTGKYVGRRQNVPDQFLRTTIAAVEQSPELQAVNKLDPAGARDALDFIDEFRPVLDRVAAFARDLRHTIRARRAILRNDALHIYAVGKAIARDASSTAVASHVENMGRDLARVRTSKRQPPPQEGTPAN